MSVLIIYLFADDLFGENMNATNYYVSTSRVVLQGDPEAAQTWQVSHLSRLKPIKNQLLDTWFVKSTCGHFFSCESGSPMSVQPSVSLSITKTPQAFRIHCSIFITTFITIFIAIFINILSAKLSSLAQKMHFGRLNRAPWEDFFWVEYQ